MVKIGTCLKWFFIGLVVLFIYAPIVLLTVNSFNASDRIQIWDGFSLEHYKYFFDFDHEPLPIVLQTLALAAVVATLSTLLGTVGAIGIFYSKKKVAGALSGVNRIPVINAEVVTAISFALLVTALNVDKSTYIPLILGQMVLCTPFVVLSVIPKLKQMDNNLYEAALDLGATPTRALFSVIIPQILPGILSGFLLAVTLSLDDYVIAAYTKPRFLPDDQHAHLRADERQARRRDQGVLLGVYGDHLPHHRRRRYRHRHIVVSLKKSKKQTVKE